MTCVCSRVLVGLVGLKAHEKGCSVYKRLLAGPELQPNNIVNNIELTALQPNTTVNNTSIVPDIIPPPTYNDWLEQERIESRKRIDTIENNSKKSFTELLDAGLLHFYWSSFNNHIDSIHDDSKAKELTALTTNKELTTNTSSTSLSQQVVRKEPDRVATVATHTLPSHTSLSHSIGTTNISNTRRVQ